jgi:hypothetical protein
MANILSQIFNPKPKDPNAAPVGGGLADMARSSILDKQYKDHVAIATQTGEQPMSYEEFIKSRQQ